MPGFYYCIAITLVEAVGAAGRCMTGPSPNTPGMPSMCAAFDLDHDGDVDLKDVAKLMNGEIE